MQLVVGTDRQCPFLKGYLECDKPNPELYEFRGKLHISENNSYLKEVLSLSENQLLLKGSKLLNTDWVVGIVVYSGNDTKLMMN